MTLNHESVSCKVSSESPEAAPLLRDLIRPGTELARDLHFLSRRLHSAPLRSLGLLPGCFLAQKTCTMCANPAWDFPAAALSGMGISLADGVFRGRQICPNDPAWNIPAGTRSAGLLARERRPGGFSRLHASG